METAEDLDHDAFGSEGDELAWRPQRPARHPPVFWIGTGVLAIALGTGAFVGMRSAANKATTTVPANSFPPGAYGPRGFGPYGGPNGGPPGGPRFGPPPDDQQQQPQQPQQQQQGATLQ